MNDRGFILELKKYIPMGSRRDPTANFNYMKLHWMIDEHLKK